MQTTANTLGTAPAGVEFCDGTASPLAWSAILAGALTAAATSLTLFFLGSGFGLAAVSPWANAGVSAGTFAASTVVWLIVMQWTSSALGGYLTGRLRRKWRTMHTDEVLFRDTAHGLLAWVIATLLTAALLTSAVTTAVKGTAAAATTVAAGAAAGGGKDNSMSDPTAYFVDSLYRSDRPNATVDKEMNAETTRIFFNGVKNKGIPDADKTYLARLVSARTGLSEPDATTRVNEVVTQMDNAAAKAKEDADAARKSASKLSLYMFLSMLLGAFIASATAALGGMTRDKY